MTTQTQIPFTTSPRIQSALGHAVEALSQARLLIVLSLAHLVLAMAIATWLQVPFVSGTASRLFTMLRYVIPAFLIFLMFWRFAHVALIVRPQAPVQWFAQDLRNFCFDGKRLTIGILSFAAVSLFTGGFSFIKDVLPEINSYSWDPTIAQLDRWLHGGTDPYVLLSPLLDSPFVTTWLNVAYHFWFFLLYFVTFMCCFDRDHPVRRNTFLIGFVLTWAVGGNYLATIFASGGPVYYQAFGYGDIFLPLINKLHSFAEVSPVWALDVQATLLDGFVNDGPVKGISAMPSMHLAGSALMTCHAFTWRRWAGWLMVVFTLLILLGSVHLGWHYAIDGYLGIPLGIGAWFGARALVRAFPTA